MRERLALNQELNKEKYTSLNEAVRKQQYSQIEARQLRSENV